MFKDLLICLELSDSDIETAVQTWSTVQDNPLIHNYVVEAVINIMDKSTEEEDKYEAQEVE